jgi:hypothetical protein
MGYALGAPGNTEARATVPYTHVNMASLMFKFPARDQLVSARIEWETGTLDGTGKFVMLNRQLTKVPEAVVRNFLADKDTRNKATFIKLEEAMFAYLVSRNLINAGTVVVIPE